jgi:hypothetical protein
MSEPLVFLAMPHASSRVEAGAAMALWQPSLAGVDARAVCLQASLLTHSFNCLWASMLNDPAFTHFAMIHSDVCPDPGWLDVLLAELDATGADLVSAVVPLKNGRGLTSTALDTGDPWCPRRLSLAEIWERDETWTEPGLLLNTGLWVCRRGDWCERVQFRQQDRVRRGPSGTFEVHTIPEDWDFTRQVREHGGRVYATRKVHLYHERREFHTAKPWGQWKTDEEYVALQKKAP